MISSTECSPISVPPHSTSFALSIIRDDDAIQFGARLGRVGPHRQRALVGAQRRSQRRLSSFFPYTTQALVCNTTMNASLDRLRNSIRTRRCREHVHTSRARAVRRAAPAVHVNLWPSTPYRGELAIERNCSRSAVTVARALISHLARTCTFVRLDEFTWPVGDGGGIAPDGRRSVRVVVPLLGTLVSVAMAVLVLARASRKGRARFIRPWSDSS